MDVMAQIKRPAEDITHPDASVKRLKEMVKSPKRKEKESKAEVSLPRLSNF